MGSGACARTVGIAAMAATPSTSVATQRRAKAAGEGTRAAVIGVVEGYMVENSRQGKTKGARWVRAARRSAPG
ncbi:hypothetical protein GCM10007242_12330 [Pigmentiphaga litoralis]|nr:hypothetical protein GCM10007242_12330 [Pigmentiphaga litoralis]